MKHRTVETRELRFLLGVRGLIVEMSETYRTRFHAIMNRHLAGAKLEPGAEKLWVELLCDVGSHLPCRMHAGHRERVHRSAA